jgi:hypothetical protein
LERFLRLRILCMCRACPARHITIDDPLGPSSPPIWGRFFDTREREFGHGAVGAQNDLRYAVFPRRLVINDGGHVEIYDTGNHRIFGVAQAQSADQTPVRVKDLPKVRDEL